MAAPAFVRCQSFCRNGSHFTHRASLPQIRRQHRLSAAARKISVKCSATPSFDDFEQIPDHSGYNFDESLPNLSNTEWEMDAAMMPWAAGLNLQPDYKMDQLAHPLVFFPTSQRVDLNFDEATNMQQFSPRDDRPCYVIIFTMKGEETEGIYTLRTNDDLDLPVETVVAFEEQVDAERFSTLLEASLNFIPSVIPISWGDMTEWCNENNARCRLEPAGSLLIPPEAHVGITDWERSMALHRGQYFVLDDEPVLPQQQQQQQTTVSYFDGPDWAHEVVMQEASSTTSDVSNIVDGKLADSTLASIRADLERLMKH